MRPLLQNPYGIVFVSPLVTCVATLLLGQPLKQWTPSPTRTPIKPAFATLRPKAPRAFIDHSINYRRPFFPNPYPCFGQSCLCASDMVMQKTAMNENYPPALWENEFKTARQIASMKKIAIPTRMQCPAKRQLRLGILASNVAHHFRASHKV